MNDCNPDTTKQRELLNHQLTCGCIEDIQPSSGYIKAINRPWYVWLSCNNSPTRKKSETIIHWNNVIECQTYLMYTLRSFNIASYNPPLIRDFPWLYWITRWVIINQPSFVSYIHYYPHMFKENKPLKLRTNHQPTEVWTLVFQRKDPMIFHGIFHYKYWV